MSNSIQSINEHARQEASLSNDDVVALAIEAYGKIDCPNCDYPNNAKEYGQLLKDYSFARLAETKAHRQCRTLIPSSTLMSFLTEKGYSISRTYYRVNKNSQSKEVDELSFVSEYANDLRHKMKAIRPCYICKLRYNPTSRTRMSGEKEYPKPNKPVEKTLIHV